MAAVIHYSPDQSAAESLIGQLFEKDPTSDEMVAFIRDTRALASAERDSGDLVGMAAVKKRFGSHALDRESGSSRRGGLRLCCRSFLSLNIQRPQDRDALDPRPR